MERATGFEPATLGLEAASTKFRYRSPTFGIRATIGFFILWRFRRRSSQWAAVRQVRQADHSSGRRGWPPRVAFGADRFRPPVLFTSCRGGYAVVGGFPKDWLTVVRD